MPPVHFLQYLFVANHSILAKRWHRNGSFTEVYRSILLVRIGHFGFHSGPFSPRAGMGLSQKIDEIYAKVII